MASPRTLEDVGPRDLRLPVVVAWIRWQRAVTWSADCSAARGDSVVLCGHTCNQWYLCVHTPAYIMNTSSFQCVRVDLPAKDEREADVERKVELVDVVQVIKNQRD